MKTATRLGWGLAAVLVLLVSHALGQGIGGPRPSQGRSSYAPSRPTVSPWLGLNRRGASPTNNYYTLVRPQIQQQAALRQQASNIGALQQSVQAVQQQQQRLETPLVAPTGIGGQYRSFSHFYSGLK